MSSAIAVSTYFDTTTRAARLLIFHKSIRSLVETAGDCDIFLMDDCSERIDHLKYAERFGDKITIIRRTSNGGESIIKNSSINTMKDIGYEWLFLADDDMEYYNGWNLAYITAMRLSGINHMAYMIPGMAHKIISVNGVQLKRGLAPTTNGCFLVFHKSIIDAIGGFPQQKYYYGHGHENYSMRCLKFGLIPYYCDLADVDKYVQLQKESNPCQARKIDRSQIRDNFDSLRHPKYFEKIKS